jgi:membrane-bound serine protease (ClpP class)
MMNRLRELIARFRWLVLLGVVAGLVALPVQAQSSRPVYVMTFDGPVNPILLSYVERGIALAEDNEAAALILRLDTPGGQVDLTQDIVKAIHASSVPVVVYVWPKGAMAGSAGTFITLAGHAAAMVPGSSIGAASPVDGSGQDLGETIQKKLINILTADMENLAQRRGEKAVEWARSAVEDAAAATADQALDLGVIDAVATDVDDLLAQLNGLQVEVNGQSQQLQFENVQVVEEPLSTLEGFLNALINAIILPGIAVLLIVLGVQAIISEFSQPGGYVAGIVGAIALMLGLYALGILHANWVGLGFILLSFVLFLVDIKAPTHGALTAGGIVTFILGAVVLFSGTEVAVPWPTIIGLAVFSALFFGFVIAKSLQSQRLPPAWGAESLVGQEATARTELNPSGKVLCQGEWWDAELEGDQTPLPPGTLLTVVSKRGFKLLVRPAPPDQRGSSEATASSMQRSSI